MKYIGIDLHATNSVVAIVDAQEQVLYCKRHANRLQHILALLRPYRDSGCVAAVESTYNWYWLIDGLKAEGFDVRLANSAALPQYPGLKYSDDETDAIKLARLLARGILPEGYIYPVEERGVRDLLRRRLVLVRTRAQQLTAIDGLLARHLGASMTSSLLKRLDALRFAPCRFLRRPCCRRWHTCGCAKCWIARLRPWKSILRIGWRREKTYAC